MKIAATDFSKVCFLYPSDLLKPKQVDEHFRPEAQAARELGLKTRIIDDGALHDPGSLRLGELEPGIYLYRGWMLDAEEFTALEQAISQAGGELLTDGAAYLRAHHLPGWYQIFSEHTPFSVWGDVEQPQQLLDQLPDGAAIVKDHVKSLKHLWEQACYIPDVRDTAAALSVIETFKSLRGDIQGGLILRQFEPLSDEYRSWWVDGQCRLISAHPDTPEKLPPDDLDLSFLEQDVAALDAAFISVDVAKNKDTGEYRVVEVGDGGVSDRPVGEYPLRFYQQLFLIS